MMLVLPNNILADDRSEMNVTTESNSVDQLQTTMFLIGGRAEMCMPNSAASSAFDFVKKSCQCPKGDLGVYFEINETCFLHFI